MANHATGRVMRMGLRPMSATPGAGFGGVETFFQISGFKIVDKSTGLEVANSEGLIGNPASTGANAASDRGFEAKARTLRGATLNIKQATLITDAGANPFLVPQMLVAQTYVKIRLWPDWDTVPLRWHDFPSLYIETLSHEGEIVQGQPIEIDGLSDGTYVLWSSINLGV